MASAIPEEVTERLTCAICMEQFKEPKVLPCLHTYCKACLVKLVKNKGSVHIITCPECRQDSNVPDGDAGRLQPNFWVNNFMTLLSMQNSASSTGNPLICEHCDSGDLAVSRCSDCSVFMCEFCVTAHKRINTTKNHQILSLTEVKKLGSKALAKPMVCPKHKGETLKLFCSTCQNTICRDCTIVDHREHKYDFVTDVAEKEKEIIQSSLTKATAKQRTVVESMKAVQMMKNGVQKKLSELNKEVDAFFDEQVKALEYYRANIKHEVSTEVQIRVNKLENQEEVLSSILAQLKSGISFTNQALQDGDAVKLLAMKKQLIQQLDQLNSSQTQCKPCTDDYLKVQVHQTIWDTGKIVTLCYVPFDPQKCTVSMLGGEEGVMYQTLAGQEVELELLIKDETGQKSNKGGHQVGALLTFSCETSVPGSSQVPVRDNRDGSYRITCHPVEEGDVTLSVTVEGQEVRGSPFKWNVTSNLPNGLSSPQLKESASDRQKGAMKMSRRRKLQLSAFREGKHCWKLQLTSFRDVNDCEIEIGITSSGYDRSAYGDFVKQANWSWKYRADTLMFSRSDNKLPSVTSVENNDVFIVFLNLETKKLTIYNVRSKQTETFTSIEGNVSPVIRCQSLRHGFRLTGDHEFQYPRLTIH